MNVIRSSMRRACLLTICVLAVGVATAANAQTVLIDFGNNEAQYRGIPVPSPDLNGNYWNSIQPGLLVENMKDIDNNITTIDLAWDTAVGTDSYNGPSGGATDAPPLEQYLQFVDIDAAALGNLGVVEAVFDYAAGPDPADPVSGHKARFQLQGLDPNKTYDLTMYGAHIYSFDATTVYSVYTDDTYSTLVASTTLDIQDPADFLAHNRDKVAVLTGLAPQADNILYFEFVGMTGFLGYLNDMQIEASAPAGVVGDYNSNLTVDAADYTVWRDKLGSTSVLPNDPVGGTIGTTQYNNWKANFGMTAGSGLGGVSAVPEPGSILLCIVASVAALCLRSRR